MAAIVLGVDQETELKGKQRLKREKVYVGVLLVELFFLTWLVRTKHLR